MTRREISVFCTPALGGVLSGGRCDLLDDADRGNEDHVKVGRWEILLIGFI